MGAVDNAADLPGLGGPPELRQQYDGSVTEPPDPAGGSQQCPG